MRAEPSDYALGRSGLSRWLIRSQAIALAAVVFFLGASAALAQSIGPDEAVNPDGAVTQEFGLTAAQKAAIYNAVRQQHVRSIPPNPQTVPAAVGAPVSPTTELAALPVQAAADDPLATDLKYAMVEDNVVVVDPIKMRVVEVIHRNPRP
ncbi:MAG: hypothetical protein ABSE22_06575 [Xanthobacteraceae bacterium]|jgi:hypothetical protein